MILPFSLEKALLGYVTNEGLFSSDPSITRLRTLDFKSSDQVKREFKSQSSEDSKSISINVADIAMPPPFNPRIFHFSSAMNYDIATNSFIFIAKPFSNEHPFGTSLKLDICNKKDGTPINQKVYTYFNLIFTYYKVIDEGKVLFSQVHLLNLGGWSQNKSLLIYAGKERGKGFKSTLTLLSKNISDDVKILDLKDKLCLEENGIPVDGLGKLLFEAFELAEKNKKV
jgi:hypothetical protein